MPRDGSGNYSRAVTPPVNGDVANATNFNSEINDVGTALSDSINRNGTKAFAANQSMGGFKLTNLATPTVTTDAATKAYVDGLGGTLYQPLDATLTAVAAGATGANVLFYWSGVDTLSTTTLTAVGRALLDDATASDQRTTLELGTAAVKNTGTTGNVVPLLNVANTWSEEQKFTKVSSGATTALKLEGSGNNVSEVLALRADAPDALGRAEIQFGTSAGGTGSDSYLAFVTNQYGVARSERVRITNSALQPGANDGLTLGTAALSFADVFVASGGVINWNNSAVTLTQGANALIAKSPAGTMILTVEGGAGYGGVYLKGSGTSNAYLWFANATNSERGRILVTDTRAMRFSLDNEATSALELVSNDVRIYANPTAMASNSAGFRGAGPGAEKTANYVFVQADEGQAIDMNAAGATTLTINTGVHTDNAVLFGANIGAGTTTLTRGAGVTFRDASGVDANQAVAQYKQWTARKDRATNTWFVRVF